MSLSGHQSARMKNDEWLTPPGILGALGKFDLDPCSPILRPWPTAAEHFHVLDDGLSKPWAGRVWLTIAEDDTISSCLSDCRKHHPRNVQNAEWSSRFPLSISVPAPADHLAFVHVAGSVWHKTTPNESGEPENSAQANDGNTQNQGCSNALNAGLCIQQHLNTSGQSQNAAMASPHGAANVQEQKRAMAGQSSGSPTKESRRSRKSGSDISNPNEEGKPSRPAHECITQSDASVELICRLSGAMPTGWTVSELLGASAHTAGLQTTCTKTTSSHYHTLNVPELLSATWSPHVGHATCQKAQSIQVPGLRTKLLSLGLIEPCGCFIGTYKPRIWLNPPFGREAVKWLRRMAEHGNGIALIPARTETAMFYECVWGVADAVLFLKGRPHFHFVDGRRAPFNSGAPICLVAYGVANRDALISSGLGFVAVGHPNQPPKGED